jgi:hypothetical protein
MRLDEVVSVRVAGPFRLSVRFADGVSGEVEFRESFFRGVFAPLRDPERFAEVHCDQGSSSGRATWTCPPMRCTRSSGAAGSGSWGSARVVNHGQIASGVSRT